MTKSRLMISLLLVFAMILSCVPAAFAEGETQTAEILSIKYSDEVAGGYRSSTVFEPGKYVYGSYVNKALHDSASAPDSTQPGRHVMFNIGVLYKNNAIDQIALTAGSMRINPVDASGKAETQYDKVGGAATYLQLPSLEEIEKDDYTLTLFALYDNKELKPLAPAKSYKYISATATIDKVNGVILTWTKVPGAAGYKIIRDGAEVATAAADATSYNDIYFYTTEQLVGEEDMTATGITKDNVSAEHKYTVKAVFADPNIIAESEVTGKADTSKYYYYSLNGATEEDYKKNYNGCENGIDTALGTETVNGTTVSKNAVIEKSATPLNVTGWNGYNVTGDTTLYQNIAGYTGSAGRYTDEFYGKPAFGFVQVLREKGNLASKGYGTGIPSLFVDDKKLSLNTKYRLLINCYFASQSHSTTKIFGRPGDKIGSGNTLSVKTIGANGIGNEYDVSNGGNGYFSKFTDYGKYVTYTFEHPSFVSEGASRNSLNFRNLNAGEVSFDENGFAAAVHSVALVDPTLYIMP